LAAALDASPETTTPYKSTPLFGTMHISTLLATLVGASAVTAAVDLGYWDVNITDSRGAQGDQARFTSAIHSSNPNRTIIDEYRFHGGNVSTFDNDNTFKIDIRGICGNGPSSKHTLSRNVSTIATNRPPVVTIKQRVDINVHDYWLVGSANVTFKINTVTGRGGTASFRVNATLDETAVDVCGRPLNRESS